jgi:hypothetical protein
MSDASGVAIANAMKTNMALKSFTFKQRLPDSHEVHYKIVRRKKEEER